MSLPDAQPIRPGTALLLMVTVLALLILLGLIGLGQTLPGLAAAQVVAFALPAWMAARLDGLSSVRALALVRPGAGALAGAALLAVSYWYLSAVLLLPLVAPLIEKEETDFLLGQFSSPEPLAIKLAVFALLPALCEEVLVRGAIARGMRPRLGLLGAALLSSAYFAVLHGSLARMPITFLLGMVLAAATLRSGSVVPAILIHFGNNAAAVLLVQPQLLGVVQALSEGAALVLPLAALASGIGFALVWRSAKAASD